MGLEGLVALLPVVLIAVLTLLVRVLFTRRKKERRASAGAEAPPELKPASSPEPGAAPPASAERLSRTEFVYPTPIQIKKLQAAGEGVVESREKQEQEATRGLLWEQLSPPPEKPAAPAHPLDRLTPLQRAVVWAEILGPPKAEI